VLSSRFSFVVACSLVACLLVAVVPRATFGQSPAAAHTVYLPLAARRPSPIGIVTTPAELVAVGELAAHGVEPSRRAVKSLLSTADEALQAAPCAAAFYTTAAVDCLDEASQYSYALALASYITGDQRYSDKAAAFIRAWSGTLTAIDLADNQNQLDWSRMAPAMIWAADLLEGTPGWLPSDRQRFQTMLVAIVLPQGQQAARRWNNWADAGNLLRLSIAIYAGLPAERDATMASWKQHLDGLRQPSGAWLYGMLPDGSLAEENRRGTSGLSYNQGALSLKTVFAEILRRRGDGSLYDYRTPRGVGLKRGWDFLAPQVVNASAGACTWPYTPDHCVDYSNRSGWEVAYAFWRDPAYLGPIQLHRPYQWSNWADPGYSTLLFGRP
jgi:hypothetical protein